MPYIYDFQSGVVVVLALVILGLCLTALFHAVRAKPTAYVAAGKRTKGFWLAVVGICTLLSLASVGGGPGLLMLLPAVGAGVFLADVHPALRQVSGRGGGGNQGPYGPW